MSDMAGLGCSINRNAGEPDLGADSVRDVWACLCGTTEPSGMPGELGGGDGLSQAGSQKSPAYRTHGFI